MVAGCQNVYLHAKANEEKLGSLQEKVSALTTKVEKIVEGIKTMNLERRKAQVGLEKAEAVLGC